MFKIINIFQNYYSKSLFLKNIPYMYKHANNRTMKNYIFVLYPFKKCISAIAVSKDDCIAFYRNALKHTTHHNNIKKYVNNITLLHIKKPIRQYTNY